MKSVQAICTWSDGYTETANQLLDYSTSIIGADGDFEQIRSLSKLYKCLAELQLDMQILIGLFCEYFNEIYLHISSYLRKERYEDAEKIQKAMKIELRFITKNVIQNFPTIRQDITALKEYYQNLYL